jgi:branched-chain amino acid transport system substrate-binding protein
VAVGGGAVWVITGSGSSGIETATVSGGPVHALPTTSCSPIHFEGPGHPRYLIASDLPLQGQGTFVPQLSQAIQFVLRQRHFRAGRYAVGYQSCDDSTAPVGIFSEARCTENARAYAADSSVIGVIGPFSSGCAEVELPIINQESRGSLATISFSNTYIGLTRAGPGTAASEPGIYYPTGRRNYVRTIATDNFQGAAAAMMANRLGAHRVYLLTEPYPYGEGTSAAFTVAAKELGLVIAGSQTFDYGQVTYAPFAALVAEAHADVVYVSAAFDAAGNLGTLLADLRAAAPGVRIVAPDGFSDFGLLRKVAGLAAEGMLISVPGAPNGRLSVTGKDFLAAFGKVVGERPQAYVAEQRRRPRSCSTRSGARTGHAPRSRRSSSRRR